MIFTAFKGPIPNVWCCQAHRHITKALCLGQIFFFTRERDTVYRLHWEPAKLLTQGLGLREAESRSKTQWFSKPLKVATGFRNFLEASDMCLFGWSRVVLLGKRPCYGLKASKSACQMLTALQGMEFPTQEWNPLQCPCLENAMDRGAW